MRTLIVATAITGLVLGLASTLLDAAEGAVPDPSAPVLLDEISDQNAPQAPTACPLATCGSVISIAPLQGNVDIQPGENSLLPIVVADDPNPVVTDNALDPFLAAPGATAYALGDLGPVWQIRVQMQNGAIQTVLQSFKPLLEIGDVVVVERNAIRLWP